MDYFSKMWTLQLGDFGRGLVVAALTTPVGILYDWAMQETFVLNWKSLLKGAVAGGLAYLMKNVFTGANGNILTNK